MCIIILERVPVGGVFQIFVHFFGTAVYIENAKEKNGCEHPF